MKFEKKYWSKGEFATDPECKNLFEGYVGILDGEAYNLQTKEKLTGLSTYLGRINTSKENFDRTLSHELRLPYGKNDVTFAANDFLYGGTVKNIVQKLQKNNDYLFQNAIISNSTIPYAQRCVLFTSLFDKDSENPVRGKLGKCDFATSAFITKLEEDDFFYPEVGEFDEYFAKNILGQTTLTIDKDTNFVETGASENKILNLDHMSARDAWVTLNDEPLYEDESVSMEEAMGSNTTNYSNIFQLSEYSYNSIPGEYTFSNPSKTFDLHFTTSQLKNMWDDLTRRNEELSSLGSPTQIDKNSQINLRIKSLSFIVKGELSEIRINGSTVAPKVYNIENDVSHVVYDFTNPVAISVNSDSPIIKLEFAAESGTVMAVSEGKIKFDAKYFMGTVFYDTTSFKYIPNVVRTVLYSFGWSDDKGNEHIAPPEWTYGYLKESLAWRSASNPALIMNNWETDFHTFIPNDNMTANDVYSFMLNNFDDYEYPKIYKNYKYDMLGSMRNPVYKDIVYSLDSYKFENEKIVPSYKTVEDVYNDIEGYAKNLCDRVPEVNKRTRAETVNEDSLWHNLNEITASDIVIKSVDSVKGKAEILIFLAFKTKLIIFRTNYYYKDESKNFSEKPLQDTAEFKDFIVDLRPQYVLDQIGNNEKQQYIEISRIDPDDNTSLEFLNLNCVKVQGNMMYLVDSKLDMVLRYDIDYLISENEPETTSFSPFSIKLLDILQGSGTSTDKIYFNNPYAIATSDEYVYIADRNNHCVKVYTPSLNFVKVIKNGPFGLYDIQTIAVNPHQCIIDGISLKAGSLWVASVSGTNIVITIIEDDIIKIHRQVEDINLLQNEYTWVEEIRGITFSETHSNYFYLNTTKRIYKFHVSKPFYPYASMSYFKQRSIVGTMQWASMIYPWHNLPSIYGIINNGSVESIKNEITWDYLPPTSSAEILDNKCFCLTSSPLFEGDIIFHFGVLYDDSKMRDYIREHREEYGGKMSFYDIELGALADMIVSSAMLMYRETDSFISSLSNESMRIYDIYKFEDSIENDYINALTFNKLIHSLVFNLLKLKNSLVGHFRAATNIDNIIVYDNLVLDDYFNNLKVDSAEDYFVHDNEAMSIIVNRTFENIYDLQEKILNKMQTEFMAAQSYVNNTSRLI